MGSSRVPPLPPRSPFGDAPGQAVCELPATVLPTSGLPASAPVADTAADDDLRLVRRLITGDAEAWQALVMRFQRLVYARVLATARELNRPITASDSEDLTAEVFSRLVADDYAALRRFEGRSTLSTWLCVITRRMALRRLSLDGREPSRPAAQPPSLDALSGAATDEPIVAMIHDEDRSLLATGMAQLGQRQQELARLFYIDGCTYRQISERLQMPVNSIGPTLARIQEKLRSVFKDSAMKERE